MSGSSGRTRAGFTLIELMIVVAIIGIIAAIAIPALLRARVSSNESATIGDVRTVHSAQTAYQGANGGYYESDFTCLSRKGGCIPGTPTTSPTYLDRVLSTMQPKSGYTRSTPDFGIQPPADGSISATSVTGFVYAATPLNQGQTGVRGFGIDGSGRICFTPDGTPPPFLGGQGLLDTSCLILK